MPRQARQLVDGHYYHILTRGNDRKRIFRSRQDYLCFKRMVKEGLEKHRVSIYHYCLMGNHMHFLIKAIEANSVPLFFKNVFQRYACRFRKRYRHTGYLFQNRYKSYLIDKESYLLECARYIERNPFRAGMADDMEGYPWTSYLYYARGAQDDIIIEKNPLYTELSDNDAERQRRYRDYILQERPYELIVDKGLRIE
jgi:putative transposase